MKEKKSSAKLLRLSPSMAQSLSDYARKSGLSENGVVEKALSSLFDPPKPSQEEIDKKNERHLLMRDVCLSIKSLLHTTELNTQQLHDLMVSSRDNERKLKPLIYSFYIIALGTAGGLLYLLFSIRSVLF